MELGERKGGPSAITLLDLQQRVQGLENLVAWNGDLEPPEDAYLEVEA